jgi:predicted AAA+ superfamily ATPase
MLYRKFTKAIENHLLNQPDKILLVNGARQTGKSYLIRYVGKKLFQHYVEINLKADKEGDAVFEKVRSVRDFYLQLGALYGDNLDKKENTLVFLDEIQSYPHLLTMLKFLNQDGRYTYIASGSQLGVALSQTPSVPIGSISTGQMYPMDFEEFLIAMGCGRDVIDAARQQYEKREAVSEALHNYLLGQFKIYLLVGGLPEAINTYLASNNITRVRGVQHDIHDLYRIDASQYDNEHKLVIRRIYDMIPSNLENKKKRVVVKDIEKSKGHKQFSDYADEWEYLTNSGIALAVKAISNPKFPLVESEQKNLLKLYLNDVGLLTGLLYGTNINAVLYDDRSINLGTVYESVVAQELHAHGFALHYFDNKKRGEVDFLVDDFRRLSVLPIEVKSGKDYTVHSALDNFLSTPDYHIGEAVVFSNEREVKTVKGITYLPIYDVMFMQREAVREEDTTVKPLTPPRISSND